VWHIAASLHRQGERHPVTSNCLAPISALVVLSMSCLTLYEAHYPVGTVFLLLVERDEPLFL
jgi:hypothetical protein